MSKGFSVLTLMVAIGFLAPRAVADSLSFTGTLGTPESTFTTTFTLAAAGDVTLQTWGFGGGINAAGTVIAPGGFDPFLGLFSGTGSSAAIVTDGMGNPFGTADTLSNYSSFGGCPPGSTVNIGGAVCGDVTMTLALTAGTYTVLLSDADYLPTAIFNNGTLGQGFTDLTAGAFQTCNTTANGTTCATDSGNWAFDLKTTQPVATPEPAPLFQVGLGLSAFVLMRSATRVKRNFAN